MLEGGEYGLWFLMLPAPAEALLLLAPMPWTLVLAYELEMSGYLSPALEYLTGRFRKSWKLGVTILRAPCESRSLGRPRVPAVSLRSMPSCSS